MTSEVVEGHGEDLPPLLARELRDGFGQEIDLCVTSSEKAWTTVSFQ